MKLKIYKVFPVFFKQNLRYYKFVLKLIKSNLFFLNKKP